MTAEAGMLASPAPEHTSTAFVFEVVRRATAWLDAHNGRAREEVTHRILKLVEEVGEVGQARIGQLGQNPRKGVTHSQGDLAAELADVVMTALVVLQSLDLDPTTVLRQKAETIAARLERFEREDTEGSHEHQPTVDHRPGGAGRLERPGPGPGPAAWPVTTGHHSQPHAAKETLMTTDDNIPAEELGVRALPPDATPAQRAHAEACWRPATADQPCRCSGTDCEHGQPCQEDLGDASTCPGRYIHTDRYPGSMLELSAWWDEYACDGCGDGYGRSVSLPEIPWGEHVTDDSRPTTKVYPGVRHPSFPEEGDEAEGEAPACHECLVGRHRLCPDADVGDHQADHDDPDYELVEMYCCCGREWTERQLTTAAEYATYAEEVTRLHGYGQDPGEA